MRKKRNFQVRGLIFFLLSLSWLHVYYSGLATCACKPFTYPTNIASVHLVMGDPNARAGVEIVFKKIPLEQIHY